MSRGWGKDEQSLREFLDEMLDLLDKEDEPCKLDGRNCTGHPHYGGKL